MFVEMVCTVISLIVKLLKGFVFKVHIVCYFLFYDILNTFLSVVVLRKNPNGLLTGIDSRSTVHVMCI